MYLYRTTRHRFTGGYGTCLRGNAGAIRSSLMPFPFRFTVRLIDGCPWSCSVTGQVTPADIMNLVTINNENYT